MLTSRQTLNIVLQGTAVTGGLIHTLRSLARTGDARQGLRGLSPQIFYA